MRDALLAMAEPLARSFAFVGLGVAWGTEQELITAANPKISARPNALFRVASVSKYVTGRVMHTVMEQCDIPPPYANDVSDVLGYKLHPDMPVTFGMLASHSAGLIDDVVPPNVSLQSYLQDNPAVFQTVPGTYFSYSNLGYVILAAALEIVMDTPFDVLASEELEHFGVTGGFNWSGVSATDRHSAIPTYRRDNDQFVAQVDQDIPADGLILSDGTVFDRSRYQPGWNPAVFAPQGGLRTNLGGMLKLAKSLANVPSVPIWKTQDGPGDYLDGLMQDYGLGLQFLQDPPFYPRPLIGHFGNAYGFNGGIWYDWETDTAFAYALNGLPVGDESDALSDVERQIFEAVADLP